MSLNRYRGAVLLFATACTAASEQSATHDAKVRTESPGTIAVDSTRGAKPEALAKPVTSTRRETSAQPDAPAKLDTSKTNEPVRALYVNRWAAQSSKKMAKLIRIADSTEINALVIDMKDEFGLNYRSADPALAKNAGASSVVPRVGALLDSLKAHKILSIARIVVFKDSVTARVHPEWTIRRADGSIWRDHKGIAWVNPYHRELWEYNIGVAEELVKLGFGEVQFDYIRFPEPFPSLPKQVFPDAGTVSKQDALAEYLKLAKTRINALGVRSTADIFGLVTTVSGALEVGQQWEKLSPHLDVVLPMVYPSHYHRGDLGIDHPNSEPYKIILASITRARERDKKLGIQQQEHVRPWLQAFTLGTPRYGPEQLEAQKKAVYDSGYDGWVMWNPGSAYDIYAPALEKTFVSRKK